MSPETEIPETCYHRRTVFRVIARFINHRRKQLSFPSSINLKFIKISALSNQSALNRDDIQRRKVNHRLDRKKLSPGFAAFNHRCKTLYRVNRYKRIKQQRPKRYYTMKRKLIRRTVRRLRLTRETERNFPRRRGNLRGGKEKNR